MLVLFRQVKLAGPVVNVSSACVIAVGVVKVVEFGRVGFVNQSTNDSLLIDAAIKRTIGKDGSLPGPQAVKGVEN